MIDPTIQFYNAFKPHFNRQLNGTSNHEKRIKKTIKEQSPDRLVEMIVDVEVFIKQHPAILRFKDDMWKNLISQSTTKTNDGEFIHEITPNHKVKFKTRDELLKYLNEKIVPVVMGHFDQAYARILVEYYVRTVIEGLNDKDKKDQIAFLVRSLKLISEKEELSKYLKGKISEHLNYYKQILEIQKRDFDSTLFFNVTEGDNISRLKQALSNENFSDFIEILKPIFASIPYQLIIDKEKYYHTIFYLILILTGFEILAEVSTNLGRIDAVIEINNLIYIVEFKMDDADSAIKQIKVKKYFEKYKNKSKKLILAGIAFDRAQKNIGVFKLENFESN